MSEQFDPEAGQPLPITTKKSIDVAIVAAERLTALGCPRIAAGIEARILIGERKYGSRFKTHNGRDVYKDLLDEFFDFLNYLEQGILEGEEGFESLFIAVVPVVKQVEEMLNARENLSEMRTAKTA